MKVLGASQLMAGVVERGLCIGCGACVSLCPYFRSYNGMTAMLFPCTMERGRCYAYCPKIEVDLDRISQAVFCAPYSPDPLGTFRSIHIARAGKMMNEGNPQTGGTVTALMTYALREGIIDAAVLTGRKGMQGIPEIVTDADAVISYASSTYTASPTLSSFNEAATRGFNKIGVVATPCQSLALAQMRSNLMEADDFADDTGLVVGLFCTWSLDYRSFKKILSRSLDIGAIIKFDIPPPPADIMEINTLDGTVSIPLSEVRESIPPSCSYCFDMTAEFADISVGVVEGKPGMNSLIIRTERGGDAVKKAVRDGYLEISEMPKENYDRLMAASANKKKRAFEKAERDGFLNTDDPGSCSIMRVDKKTMKAFIL